jgi:hypothetical protein
MFYDDVHNLRKLITSRTSTSSPRNRPLCGHGAGGFVLAEGF